MKIISRIYCLALFALCFVPGVLALNGPVRAVYTFEYATPYEIEDVGKDPYRHTYICEVCPSVTPHFSIALSEKTRKNFKLCKIETFNNFGQQLEKFLGTGEARNLQCYPFNAVMAVASPQKLAGKGKQKMKFFRNGRLKEIKETYIDFEGDWVKRTVIFNENGVKVKDKGKSVKGNWEYTYDVNGNLLEKFRLANNRIDKLQHHKFEYDAQQRLMRHDYYINNVCVSHESFDRYGNMVESISFSNNGAVSEGYTRVYEYFDEYNYLTEEDDAYAHLKVGGLQDTVFGRQYVDLGLPSGNLWATCNLGAELPVGVGRSVAWNEDTKATPDSADYLNGMRRLARAEDVAHRLWGGAWCMPTYVDFQELADYCKWAHIRDYKGTGICYYRITGPNGKSMILPIKDNRESDKDVRCYWTANADTNGFALSYNAEMRKFNHVEAQKLACVRPVIHKYRNVDSISEYKVPDFKYPSDFYFLSPDCPTEEEMPTAQQNRLLDDLVKARQTTNTEYVDLGLSVVWAKCNYGASDSLGLGSLFFTDNGLPTLRMEKGWRMPTSAEMKELLMNCDAKTTRYGLVLTSKVPGYTDKSIFLPFVVNSADSWDLHYLSGVWKEGIIANYSFDAYTPVGIGVMAYGYIRPVCVLPK